MIQQRFEQLVKNKKCTLLGVGPMSKNCVDVVIELANEHNAPLMLIASRRQIDSEEFGGGYVNNWTTKEFAKYINDNDKRGKVILARDHGGPWQNELEKKQNFGLRQAMESAKKSYKSDLDSGFDILHIDPSVDPYATPNVSEVLDRIYELYDYCWSYAKQIGRDIQFEIGTEEQSGSTNTSEELEYTLNEVIKFCEKRNFPKPMFVVVQTGTRVMEMKNVGSFDSPIRVVGELAAEVQVPMMIDICHRYGIMMKEHNTDYLSSDALKWHPRLGIHAANVAPEFGVAETCGILEMIELTKQNNLLEQFSTLVLESDKWKKWMLPNTKANELDRVKIAGHYVFATPQFVEIKRQLEDKLQPKGIILDNILKQKIRESILRYMSNFRLTKL
ncbi:MAG: tagatose-6-phosphate kinase [Bacteroidota bacterium]|nr:tagatose-6-phosphate kinase [Bacteroidota bacterium]